MEIVGYIGLCLALGLLRVLQDAAAGVAGEGGREHRAAVQNDRSVLLMSLSGVTLLVTGVLRAWGRGVAGRCRVSGRSGGGGGGRPAG
jgi:hypothetical protein